MNVQRLVGGKPCVGLWQGLLDCMWNLDHFIQFVNVVTWKGLCRFHAFRTPCQDVVR